MPGTIRSMQLEHVFRDVQTDRASLLHGRLLRWQFDTVTLAHRCRRGASTPSPNADPMAKRTTVNRPMATTWAVPLDDTHTMQIGYYRAPEGQEPRRGGRVRAGCEPVL